MHSTVQQLTETDDAHILRVCTVVLSEAIMYTVLDEVLFPSTIDLVQPDLTTPHSKPAKTTS